MDKSRKKEKHRKGINKKYYFFTRVRVTFVPLDEKIKEHSFQSHENIDTQSWEKVFHGIPQEQLEVAICLFLGFKSDEIVKFLKLKNIRRFRTLHYNLRQTFKKQKILIF